MDAASGAIQGKGKVDVMEDYKLRMINEYKNLEEKYNKLHKMLVKYDAGKLDFTPTCPIDLLRKQASFMGQYLYILETRAVIEGIDLNAEEEKKEEKEPDTKYDDLKNRIFCHAAEFRLPIRDTAALRIEEIRRSEKYTELLRLISETGLGDDYHEWMRKKGYE